MDALRARAGGFLGAASLPRHLRRRATSHNPRHRRAMRPNAKRAKKIDDAGFAAASSRDAKKDASPAEGSFWKPGSSSRYRFAIERGLAVHWCRRARRRPERARLANRERLLLESARTTEEDEDEPAQKKNNDDDDVSFLPASRAEDVASFRASSVFGGNANAATETHWRRLETHAWHAKRFALVRRWGWALPLGAPGRGRGWRETMRRAAESVIAHDASHHAAFVLRFEGDPDGPSSSETARAALETLVGVGRETAGRTKAKAKAKAKAKSLFRSAAFAAGAVAVDATLRDESGGIVSPATFVLAKKDVQNTEEKEKETTAAVFVWVWVPAAAREEAFRFVKATTGRFSARCSLRRAEGRLCRFEVAGARAASLLETLSGNPAVLRERDGGVTPRGVRSFEAPIDAKSVAEARRERKKKKEGGAAEDSDRFFSRGGGGSARAFGERSAETETGDGSRLLAAVAGDVFAGTSPSNDRRSSNEKEKAFCPATIIRRAKPPASLPGGADPGYTLLAPAPLARELWLALVALGASAAGLREWRWLAVAAGARVFPEDFPESQAATRDVQSVLAEASERATRTPCGKRVPDDVVEFAARAAAAFVRREHLSGERDDKKKEEKTYARAVVRCFRGGNPAVGAAVLAPTQAQRDAARRGARDRDRQKRGAPRPETDVGVVDGASSFRNDSRIDDVFAKTNGSRAPDRGALARGCERQTVLGYVTSASAPGAARGVASAVVDVRALEEAFPGVFAKENKKKTFSKARVAPAALLAPSASPAAIAPATLELVDDARFDSVWW